MPNPKGNPQNFGNQESKELTDNLSFRVTKEMKEAVKKQENPPEFCRRAIQKALDESSSSDE